MERLISILVAIFIGALVVVLGCGWLLHTAINEGNFWKGLVAVIVGVPAAAAALVSGRVFRG